MFCPGFGILSTCSHLIPVIAVTETQIPATFPQPHDWDCLGVTKRVCVWQLQACISVFLCVSLCNCCSVQYDLVGNSRNCPLVCSLLVEVMPANKQQWALWMRWASWMKWFVFQLKLCPGFWVDEWQDTQSQVSHFYFQNEFTLFWCLNGVEIWTGFTSQLNLDLTWSPPGQTWHDTTATLQNGKTERHHGSVKSTKLLVELSVAKHSQRVVTGSVPKHKPPAQNQACPGPCWARVSVCVSFVWIQPAVTHRLQSNPGSVYSAACDADHCTVSV